MKILYLPPIAYGNLKQRPQYLAEQLARAHQVLYLDPTISLMKFLLKGGEIPRGYRRTVRENLQVRRLNGMLSAHRSFDALWRGFCLPERLQMNGLLREADAVWIGYAPWYDLIRGFRGTVIYDKMDEDTEITQNPLLRKLIQRAEGELAARADHLFVTAQKFYEDLMTKGLHPVLLPNAVDQLQAEKSWLPVQTDAAGVRVFGYVGMLAHWFDVDAIQIILDAAPENRVVLVGPEEIARISDPRVQYVGAVPKEQVGAWIASFDVCLYPFKRSPLLDTINPVKIYEYLAQNKPVLAIRSQETQAFGNLVYTYENYKQLKTIAAQPLRRPFSTQAERKAFLASNNWESRLKVIMSEL